MEAGAYVEMDAIEGRHWWFRGKRRLLAPLIQRMLERKPSAQVLEIGCGTGGNLKHFAARHRDAHFVGLDFDAGAADFAAAKSKDAYAVLRGDGNRLPFETDSVDGALALDIIEHFDDDRAICAELLRVLKPGCDLVLSVPAWPSLWSPHDDFLHHKRRYTPAGLRSLIQAAGFQIQEERGFNFLLLPAIWLIRRSKSKQAAVAADHKDGTDFFDLPRPIESLLAGLFVIEAAVVAVLPIRSGVSIMMRAQKPLSK